MVLVLGLHALALWWLLNLGVWRDRMPSPKDIAPLTVQVLRWLPGAAATASPARTRSGSVNRPRRASESISCMGFSGRRATVK